MLKYLKQLASESMIYGFAGVAARLLSIVLVPLYTRHFSPDAYGVLSLVTATMAMVTIFATLALDNSAHRWFWETESLSDRKRTIASWAWCQGTVALTFAIVLTLTAGGLSQLLLGDRTGAIYFQLAGWAIPLAVCNKVAIGWLRMKRRPLSTVVVTLSASGVAVLFIVLLVVVFGRGLRGVFEAQLIAAVLSALVSLALLRDWVNPRHFDGARLKEMLRYAVPLIPAGVAFWVNSMADRYFVQAYAGPTEVGLYQVGFSLAAVVALGTTAFQQAWGPFALSIHKQDDAPGVYAAALLGYLWIACLGASAVSILAPEALRIFTTEDYYDAWTVVPLLAFSYVMVGLTYIASVGASIAKTTAPVGVAVTVAAVVNLLLNFLLTPHWGREGAALATLVSQALVPLYLFVVTRRLFPIPYRFGTAAALLLASAAIVWVGLGAGTADPAPLWGKIGLLSLFVPMLLVLRIMRPAQLLRAVRPRSTIS